MAATKNMRKYAPGIEVACAFHHAAHDGVLVFSRQVEVLGAAVDSNDHVGAWEAPRFLCKVAQQVHVVEFL